METIRIDTDYECANAEQIVIAGDEVRFRIRPDTNSTDRQWFSFRVVGAAGRRLRFRLEGISETNIPVHWQHARPVTSADSGVSYARVSGECRVEEATDSFCFEEEIASDRQEFVFHYPYGYQEYLTNLAVWATHPDVAVSVIGKSVEGRPIHHMTITSGPVTAKKKGVWVTCRQHAGETVASFFLRGFLRWLLSDDSVAAALRSEAVINVVPMINPDGVVSGNYRDNACGVNLNRVWDNPSPETSPEILAVVEAVERWVAAGNRYDFYTDLHGDAECLAFYAFHAAEGISAPKYRRPEDYHRDSVAFLQSIADRNGDFTLREGATETLDPCLSRQYMTWRYGVLGVLFENGYSYLDYGPMAGSYVDPLRHEAMGQSYGEALAEHLAGLA